MEAEEQMLEEHLDGSSDESEESRQDSQSTSAQSTTEQPLVTSVCSTTSTDQHKNVLMRKKFLLLLVKHCQNFHRMLLLSRRRSQLRLRRRQTMLRSFYVQQLMELETSFLEMLPLPGMSALETTDVDEAQRCSDAERALLQFDGSSDEATTKQNMGFYENAIKNYCHTTWLHTFRMSKRTFHWLCDQLRDALQPNTGSAPTKQSISLEKRVALALYAFATGDDYRTIAKHFNVSRTSVCKFMRRFAEVVLEKLGTSMLVMPKNELEYNDIRLGFQRASNMPALVVGVLGICEIPVSPFSDDVNSYANEIGCATIILQALIDDHMLFRKVRIQTKRPTLYIDGPNEITKLGKYRINGQNLPCFAVAPSTSYPLRPWLMHQYENPMSPHEYDFNEAVDNLLAFKDNAFHRLFSRWQILQRKFDLEPRTMEPIATACCVLHNLLEENEEVYRDEWSIGTDMSKFTHGVYQHFANTAPDTASAFYMRDFLARTISSTEM